MEHPVFAILALAALAGLSPAAPETKKPVYRDAETHDLLVRKLRVNQNINPMKGLLPSEGEDPSKKNKVQNLVTSSDVISFNGVTTLVPKRAIIKVPDKYGDRINNHPPGNRVVGWLEFYSLNKGWVTTVEVSRVQAEGKEPLAEELSENLSKSRNLLIATYSTGPISMLPLQEKDEPESVGNQTKP
jgi:hypothetical protein